MKIPIFNAHPRAMNGIMQMDTKCFMEDNEDKTITSNNNSVKSTLTAGSISTTLTVIEYQCCIKGN